MNENKNRDTIFGPGSKCPRSGQYAVVDADGARIGPERTVVRGEPFPPTPGRDQGYVLADATPHGVTAAQSHEEVRKMSEKNGSEHDPVQIEQTFLKTAVGTAITKAVLSMLLGAILIGSALYLAWQFSGLIGELGRQSDQVWAALGRLPWELYYLLKEWQHQPILESAVASPGVYESLTVLQGPAIFLGSMLVRLLATAVAAGTLFLLGAWLLNREVVERELDGAGAITQQLRSGLGRIKPIEEMIRSVFGRSRSAWTMRLYAARVTLALGVIILVVAVLQLVLPGLFPGADRAVFFGGGAAASLVATAVSRWLNPAADLQEGLKTNAVIEMSLISFAKQAAIFEGGMGRALSSLENGDRQIRVEDVLRSLDDNSKVIKDALEHSVNVIRQPVGEFALPAGQANQPVAGAKQPAADAKQPASGAK